MSQTCSVDNCTNDVVARQLCGMHYARWKRLGDVHPDMARYGRVKPKKPKPPLTRRSPGSPPVPCSVRACSRPAAARGWCDKHYKRWQLHGDPLAYKAHTRNNEPCIVEGCDIPYIARKMCPKHYKRWQTHGDPTVVLAPSRHGEWRVDNYGYSRKYWPEHPNARKDGKVSEHTAVMAEQLGRPLCKGEFVHHINGVRTDNRPENLELWAKSHPPGQRVSELLAWAHELIERYQDDMQLWPEHLRP